MRELPTSHQDGQRPRALVLGIEHPRGAAAVRSLAKAGIAVDVADHLSPPTAMWRVSRLIRWRFLVPIDEQAALSRLESLGREEGGLLIPTNDHYLILVSRHHQRLSRVFEITVPDWDVLGRLMNKTRCLNLAEEIGIPVPLHFMPANVDELEAVIDQLDFNHHAYVLKSNLWYTGAADPKTGRRVSHAGPDAGTLRQRCREIVTRTGVFPVIEEVVPGEADRCIGVSMVVNKNHEPVVAYCVKRLKLFTYSRGGSKHPYELGANAYCESVVDKEAVEFATRLMRHAGFYGAVTIEFKRDAVDGRLKLIKADPRFVRATALSTALGLDIPLALYGVFTQAEYTPQSTKPYPTGMGWIWMEAYLYSLWKNRKDSVIRSELLALIKRLLRIRAFAYFDMRDPLPCLMLLCTAVRRLRVLENRGTGAKQMRAASG